MTPREMIRAHAYPVFAGISTVSLVVMAVSLLPLGQWARNQNACCKFKNW